MVAPLRRVLVRRPGAAFGAADPALWHYTERPNLEAALLQHGALVAALEAYGTEVVVVDQADDRADSIFVHDPVLVTDFGSIALSMGKALRRGEEEALAGELETVGVPRLGALSASARAEGGDLLWLEPQLLVVGQGFRTDSQGLAELRGLLEPKGIDLLPVDLPVADGAEACLHLQSLISLVDDRKAVVWLRMLPVALFRILEERNYQLIEAPDDEVATLGPNVLALEPSRVLVLDGNPTTRRRLERAGVEVSALPGDELCWKSEGGPTCLTRPILRAPVPRRPTARPDPER